MLPTGTVTFLFTDIVGSTARWEADPTAMQANLAEHNSILEALLREHGGHVFKVVGDAFCTAFQSAESAARAAMSIHEALARSKGGLSIRAGLHTGSIQPTDEDYFGPVVNKVARIQAAARPGQTVMSQATNGLLPNTFPTVDLGVHALKDLLEPTRLWQLGGGAFEPLLSVESVPNNLPLQPTSFVGRGAELSKLADLLRSSRLLTLTGSGGTGKSRLSLQFASENLDRFPDGVWFCEFAALPDREDVAREIATVLKAPMEENQLERARAFLRGRRSLVILDNCEHVLESVSQVVEALLATCPFLSIAATSREPLGAQGEAVFRVPSLATPANATSVHDLGKFGSTALFMDRMSHAGADLSLNSAQVALVIKICQRLDGIPLAIELAAARSGTMSLEQIERRLDERFRLLTGGNRNALSRHQTLRALLDWSVRLLDPREKDLFAGLAVFSDGWEMAAAEAICAAPERGLDEWDVLDLLTALVNKSLVVFDPTSNRYHMLESMRQYALDLLDTAEFASELRDRHAEYYVKLAEAFRGGPTQTNSVPGNAMTRFMTDYENFRAAVIWLSSAPETQAKAITAIGAAMIGFDGMSRMNEMLTLLDPLMRELPVGMDEAEFENCQAAYVQALVVNRDPRGKDALDSALLRYPTLRPDLQQTWCQMLEYSLLFAGRFAEAIRLCEAVLTSDFPVARKRVSSHYLGNTLVALGRFAEGELAFKAAFESIDPRDPNSLRSYATAGCGVIMAQVCQGKLKEALELSLEIFKFLGGRLGHASQVFVAYAALARELQEAWPLALIQAAQKRNARTRSYMCDPFDLAVGECIQEPMEGGIPPKLVQAAESACNPNMFAEWRSFVVEMTIDDFYGEVKKFPGLEFLPAAPSSKVVEAHEAGMPA